MSFRKPSHQLLQRHHPYQAGQMACRASHPALVTQMRGCPDKAAQMHHSHTLVFASPAPFGAYLQPVLKTHL